jgi:hypothetical protein
MITCNFLFELCISLIQPSEVFHLVFDTGESKLLEYPQYDFVFENVYMVIALQMDSAGSPELESHVRCTASVKTEEQKQKQKQGPEH